MLLRIISPEGEIYSGVVQKVIFPTEQGVLAVLPGHINIASPLILGTISYFPTENSSSLLESFTTKVYTLSITGGLAVVEDDIITIAIE